KMLKMRERGLNPYKNGVTPSHLSADIHRAYGEVSKEKLEEEKPKASIAGRIMAVRDFGKAGFLRIQDTSGLIQVYVAKDQIGADKYEDYKSFIDIGDIVFVEGSVFRTKTNELSISATKLEILTKS